MPLPWEYDTGVRRRNRATVAGFGVLLALLLSVSLAQGQIHGTPPSVTSMGFGGRAINGTRPSVTSLGPHGYTGFNRPSSGGPRPGNPNHRPRYPWGSVGYYGVPYYGYYGDGYYDNGNYDNGPAAENYAPDDGYTSGQVQGYVPRPPEPANGSSSATPGPADQSPPTVLVFKDGHQLEVENYAIVGNTLFDLTEGHRRKVALADLDLTATSKENDDRGIDFHLPAGSEAN
jgi:hypothetical protein